MSEPLKHCWHTSDFQHAAMNHLDVYCCFCQKSLCINYAMKKSERHGQYAPNDALTVPVLTEPAYDEPCPERNKGEKG